MKELKLYIKYNPNTGFLYWLKDKGRAKKDTQITTKDKYGYIQIKFNQKIYRGHRIAWYLYYNKWPENIIDHINGIKDDNRIENLRDVSLSINSTNQQKHREGKLPGTTFIKSLNKWQSQRYSKYLGVFSTEQEAYQRYLKEEL